VEEGCFRDPVHDLMDPRPTSEICSAMLRLGEMTQEAETGFQCLIDQQRNDGSWDEVLPGYRNLKQSTVATSIIGLLLLESGEGTGADDESAVTRAARFVLSRELRPGQYLKSLYHYGDILNVNASCAAFMAGLYNNTGNQEYLGARDRAIMNVARFQFKDGSFPYASPTRTFPYRWHLCMPDPHYQAITIYYLLISDPGLENPITRICIPRGMIWLNDSLGEMKLKWSRCRHAFSNGLTGSYPFIAYCANHLAEEKVYQEAREATETAGLKLTMSELERSCHVSLNRVRDLLKRSDLVSRYEPMGSSETLRGIFNDLLDTGSTTPAQYPCRFRVRFALSRARREISSRSERSLYFTAQLLESLSRISEEGFNIKGISD